MIVTNAGQCVSLRHSHGLGKKVIAERCQPDAADQNWMYNNDTGKIQNAMGVCLAADLHDQELAWMMDTNRIKKRGAGRVGQWKCLPRWQQKWEYLPDSGHFKIKNSSKPGLCLEVEKPGIAGTDLIINFCSRRKLSQQFWFNEVDASRYMPSALLPVGSLPSLVKPFFDGEVTKKAADGTYTAFEVSPFAKKRAAFYLTQGCAPVPTHSCGIPDPAMPREFIGQPMQKMLANISNLPWKLAVGGSRHTNAQGTCIYDPTCVSKVSGANTPLDRMQTWMSGCNAGGNPICRFCGFGDLPSCPTHYDCADGGFPKGLWSEGKRDWCCGHFTIGCRSNYDCLEDIDSWSITWTPQKQSWCCQYEQLGCVHECELDNPATWNDNHEFWCSTFGNPNTQSLRRKGTDTAQKSHVHHTSSQSDFERIVLKKFTRLVSTLFHVGSPVSTLVLCLLMLLAIGAVVVFVRPRIPAHRNPLNMCLQCDVESEELMDRASSRGIQVWTIDERSVPDEWW